MKLNDRQLAKLRELASRSAQLSADHTAAIAARDAQEEVMRRLQFRRALLDRKLLANPGHRADIERQLAELDHRLTAARAELDRKNAAVGAITQYSAPLRDTVRAVMAAAQLSPESLGVAC